VLGHPDSLIAEGIAAVLLKADFQILGKANTESGLTELAIQYQPDIILFEPAISEGCIDVIRAFRQHAPKAIIVLMTKRGAFDGLTQAIEAGASGCISVDVSSEDLVILLKSLARGDIIISRNLTNAIREELTTKDAAKPVERLSDREREVLAHVSNGLSNRQIARKLFISEHTVKVHVRSILSKLDLKNRQQAAVFGATEGLATDPGLENTGQSTP